MAAGIFNKLKKLVSVVGKRVSWMNDKVVKLIMPITNALLSSLGPAGSMVAKGISAGSSAVDALIGPNKQQSKQQFRQDFKTYRQDDFLRKNVPIDVISKHYFCRIKHESPAYEDTYPKITTKFGNY
ncbi:MAG: hypothetical protein EZS28_030088 [Streblomastix strix]|uniref:Uncharacterized protein n=1 Tax=Streblomastix strix TaxID=222440 RepID=A0A5J4UVM4_9EUKA|nr:MAG: hypothetical protein EZS28_030088 [Streblomastix strix]